MSDLVPIGSGAYAATLDRHGGALASLTHDGRDLVLPRERIPAERFPGDVLAPWPGRVDRGVYTWDGRTHRLPVTEPDRDVALHGLVTGATWDVVVSGVDWVTLSTRVEGAEGYPFSLGLQLSYALGAAGLTVQMEAFNIGDEPAPYGCGFHPYLAAPGTADGADRTPLRFAATERIEVDDRLLPTGRRLPVAGTAHDFADARPVGDLVLDDAYEGTPRDDAGRAWLWWGDLAVWWGPSLPWIQLFTPPDRGGLAVEPYTCPTGALRSGEDLVRLLPGHAHVASWGVGLARDLTGTAP